MSHEQVEITQPFRPEALERALDLPIAMAVALARRGPRAPASLRSRERRPEAHSAMIPLRAAGD